MVARSDGTPTYNLAAAVDDLEMGITHVIRGEDHISNTPKQMMVIRALGGDAAGLRPRPADPGPDKKRLSKRHGAASVEDLERRRLRPARGRERARAARLEPRRQDHAMLTVDELVAGLLGGAHLQEPGGVRPAASSTVINGRHMRLMAAEEFEEALVELPRPAPATSTRRGPGAEDLARRSAPLVKRKLSHPRRVRRAGGLALRAARDRARRLGGADAGREALDPGDRRRPRPARGARRVDRRRDQGRARRTSSTSWARPRATSSSRSASRSPGGACRPASTRASRCSAARRRVARYRDDARPASPRSGRPRDAAPAAPSAPS